MAFCYAHNSHLSQDLLTRKSVKQCVLFQSFAVTLHLPAQGRLPKEQVSILTCAENSLPWVARAGHNCPSHSWSAAGGRP